MGIGDWGLGIGDWGLGPIPNPQSPIKKRNLVIISKKYNLFLFIYLNIKLIVKNEDSLKKSQTSSL